MKKELLVTFKPGGDRILVLPDETQNKSAGGVLLSEGSKERPQQGTIIKIGPGVTEYKEKDKVLYGKSAGIKLDVDTYETKDVPGVSKEFYLMRESELFGTV